MIHSFRSKILRLPALLSIVRGSQPVENTFGAQLRSIWRERAVEKTAKRDAHPPPKKADDSHEKLRAVESVPAGIIESTVFSFSASHEQMRKLAVSTSVAHAHAQLIPSLTIVNERYRARGSRSSGNDSQQHGHEQARSSLHLLRKTLFAEIRLKNSYSDSHW